MKIGKYKNKKTFFNGVLYDSNLESRYAEYLTLLKKGKHILGFDIQVKIPIVVHKKKICNYFADFVVTLPNGQKEIHEVKGMKTDVFKLKWKLVLALYKNKYSGFKIITKKDV